MTTSSIPLKRCTKCGETKPITDFVRSKRCRDGYASECRPCHRVRVTAYDREVRGFKPFPVRQRDGLRQCTQCEEWKPDTAEYFNRNRRQKSGFTHQCRTCLANIRQANREARLTQQRIYRAESERRDRARQVTQSWRDENRSRDRANSNRWRINNPEAAQARTLRYYARKRHLPSDFSVKDWRYALEYWNRTCVYCGTVPNVIAGDHFIPLTASDCPGTVRTNIVPACLSCNSSKNAVPAEAFLLRRFGAEHTAVVLANIEAYFRRFQLAS